MKLIDKDKIVAEIEKIFADETESIKSFEHGKNVSEVSRSNARIGILMHIRSLLDTIEGKEVDLEKEIRDFMKSYHLHIKDGGRIVFENNDSPNFMCDIRHIAKHFFELGLNTKHSNIGFQNIDDILKEEDINHDSKEAKIVKEAYFVAIDKAFENFKKEE